MTRLKISDDVSIHYQCQGQGENLVLIHGLGANLAFWYMGIARPLTRHYRVITYDLRGHGRSAMPADGYSLPDMTNDLQSLLNHLEVDRAHIVGHSFGARVAMHYTISHPQRIRSLTMADTQISCLQDQVRLADWPYWKKWKRQLQEQGFHSLPAENEPINFQMLAHFNQLSGDFAHGALNHPRKAPSLRHRNMGHRGAARWERLMHTTSARQAFADDQQITIDGINRIEAPTLALFGEYSHCLASCQKLNRHIRNCKVKILPEVGHFLPAIKPRLFARNLRLFLEQQSNAHTQPRHLQERCDVIELRNPTRPAEYPFTDSFGDLVLFDRRKSASEDPDVASNG